MTKKLRDVGPWYEEQGGNLEEPKGMALKILEEAIELCIASGATSGDILKLAGAEVSARVKKGEFKHIFMQVNVEEELADVMILSAAYSHLLHRDYDEIVGVKMKINDAREWYPNELGVLKRDKSIG